MSEFRDVRESSISIESEYDESVPLPDECVLAFPPGAGEKYNTVYARLAN